MGAINSFTVFGDTSWDLVQAYSKTMNENSATGIWWFLGIIALVVLMWAIGKLRKNKK